METKNVRMSQDYNQNSYVQRNSALSSTAKITACLREMIEKKPDRFKNNKLPFTVADLGCAGGKNVIPALDSIITLIRETNPELPISVYLNDTPSTDFSLAMKTVNSGLEKHNNIWIYSIGKSFYEGLFPEDSMDLIISTTSVHWLPRTPAPLATLICGLTEELAATPEGKIWEKEADKHWKLFLDLRYKELRRDGHLIVVVPCLSDPLSGDDIRFIKQFSIWKTSFLRALAKLDLPADDDYTIPAIVKPLKYYEKTFDDKMTEMQLIETFSITNEQLKPEEDPKAYASKLANFTMAASSDILRSIMIEKEFQEESASKVLEEYRKELTLRFLESEDPQKPTKMLFVGLIMKKKSE